jgi:Pentapeptide repeats (8 copies)
MTYNPMHLSMLNEGVDKWNAWRADHPELVPELRVAPLTGRNLRGYNLQGAILTGAELKEALLENAKLQGARLDRANLEGARLKGAHIEDASLKEAFLGGADLRTAFLGNATNLDGAYLYAMDGSGHMPLLADVDWASVNLGVIDWETVQEIGDEQQARQKPSTENYRAATRAYRQLAVELRNQGMGEEADRFAYKAQLLQRIVYRRQKNWPKFATSWFLDRLAGYGYKPVRSLLIYAIIILFFAILYYVLPNNSNLGPRGPLWFTWWQALLFSIVSFHGRVQPASDIDVGYTFTWLAAIESILGLVIEITFIATFTQRFFAKETR